MNAEAAIPVESPKPRWRRRVSIAFRRKGWATFVEVATLLTLVFLPALYVAWFRIKSPVGGDALSGRPQAMQLRPAESIQ